MRRRRDQTRFDLHGANGCDPGLYGDGPRGGGVVSVLLPLGAVPVPTGSADVRALNYERGK